MLLDDAEFFRSRSSSALRFVVFRMRISRIMRNTINIPTITRAAMITVSVISGWTVSSVAIVILPCPRGACSCLSASYPLLKPFLSFHAFPDSFRGVRCGFFKGAGDFMGLFTDGPGSFCRTLLHSSRSFFDSFVKLCRPARTPWFWHQQLPFLLFPGPAVSFGQRPRRLPSYREILSLLH